MNNNTLPKELETLPDNHVDKLAVTSKRDPNRPMHQRTDIAIGPEGKQIWKKAVLSD